MNKRKIVFNLKDGTELAQDYFTKACGFDMKNDIHMGMMLDGEKARKDGSDGISLQAIIGDCNSEAISGNSLRIDGKTFSCEALAQIDPKKVKRIYMYILTVGECLVAHKENISYHLYADLWGTAYTDAARDLVIKTIEEEVSSEFGSLYGDKLFLSTGFGPGFFGMPVNEAINFHSILEGETLGIEINKHGMMNPVKSCSGFYLLIEDKGMLPLPDCRICIGNKHGCSQCRCRDISSEESDQRKSHLAILPESLEVDKNFNLNAPLGIAFDIGTTTIAGMLWDLSGPRLIGSYAITNPQRAYGSDVISRILFASESMFNIQHIKEITINAMNEIIEELIRAYGFDKNSLGRIVMVGNTAMSHFVMGANPTPLAKAPFVATFENSRMGKASELGLIGSNCCTYYLLPNIGGHVGSDITAGILATEIIETKNAGSDNSIEKISLLVDLGTNGEIVLAGKGRVLTCSTAVGPAFEGAAVKNGMRAAPGAIETVRINNSEVEISVIGNITPIGICGSGIIDIVAEFLNHGIIDRTGKFTTEDGLVELELSDEIISRIRMGDRGKEFVLFYKKEDDDRYDIVITQKDIREIQMAKAAIKAGIKILMSELEINEKDINQVLLAGAFGHYIKIHSAVTIGLFPSVDISKIMSAGNTSCAGASLAMLSDEKKKQGEIIARKVKHIEIANYEDFQTEYLNAMMF